MHIEKQAVMLLSNKYLDRFQVDKTKYYFFENKYVVYLSSEINDIENKVIVYASEKNPDGNYSKVFIEDESGKKSSVHIK